MLLATLQFVEDDERRTFERIPVERASTLRGSDARAVDIVVQEFSPQGFSFTAEAMFQVGDVVRVGLAGAGQSEARVARRSGNTYGCAFLQPLSPQRVAEAFTHQQVVDLQPEWAGPAAMPSFPEPVVEKWPGAVRVSALVGLPVLLWAVIINALVPLFR